MKGCSFEGERMAFWRKRVTVGTGFEVSYAQDTARYLNQLPVACKMQHCQLQHLPTGHLTPYYDDNGLTSQTVSKPLQLNVFFIRVSLAMVSLYSSGDPN